MSEIKINRKYKDSLFRTVFGREEHKPWLLDLYNALNNSHYENVEDLTLTTIEDVVYVKMKNDISFLLDSRMNLIEHQSTYNPNMPLRGLFYFTKLYQEYVSSHDISVYNSVLRKIPTPEYIVFYNGNDKELPDITELKLSDAFEIPRSDKKFEWTCKVININPGHNAELNKKCKPLYDYTRFVSKVKQYKDAGLPHEEAINKAVDWAMEENLLDGLFKRERSQIMGDILCEFDEELFVRTTFQDGKEEGLREGARQKSIEVARNFLANGVSPEIIAKSVNMPLEEVLALRLTPDTEGVEDVAKQ